MPQESAYPQPLAEAESKLRPALRVGLALSGGGIRSATFSLGVLQSLARHGLLGKIDVLSTVSGGGYIGAFLGGLFVGPRGGAEAPAEAARWLGSVGAVKASLEDDASPPLDWLRENGRYLSPNGSGDLLVAGGVVFRNWVAMQVVWCTLILTALLALLLAREGSRAWLGPTWAAFGAPELDLFQTACLVALVPCVAFGWAYWLLSRWAWLGAAGVVIGAVLAPAFGAYLGWWHRGATLLVAPAGALALLSAGWAWLWHRRGASRWLSECLRASLVAEVVALLLLGVDRAGAWCYVHWGAWSAIGMPALTGALGLVQRFAPLAFDRGAKGAKDAKDKTRQKLPLGLFVDLAALLLVGVLVVVLESLAYGIGGGFEGPLRPEFLAGGVAVGLLLSWSFGLTTSFLNNSSLRALYGARLERAYLGASNPRRWNGDQRVTHPVPGDDVGLSEYEPHKHGGPLHIVNVTLNETVSGASNIEQQDRKGMNLALGPAGISVGRDHHALWEPLGKALRPLPLSRPDRFAVWGYEPNAEFERRLTVADWVSISGAAFTTGLGARTRLGFSLLLGFFNVRLGHWWDSRVGPWKRALARASGGALPSGLPARLRGLLALLGSSVSRPSLPASVFTFFFRTQSYLLDEFLARFHGPARSGWYLSDGGHFENTAAYELIRRRVPLIVVCDNGADPDYELEDLGILVRKARVDFGAEVRFLTASELQSRLDARVRPFFGAWDEFRRFDGRKGGPYATIAEVRYDDGSKTTLLVVKPGLRGDEPLDVISYWRSHAAFPQQTTADQFFDEAQWESHRRLGLHVADALFGPAPAPTGWTPSALVP